jgi:hypothetical protein
LTGCHFARKLLRVGVITGCSIFPATASAVSRAIASVSPSPESDVALEEWVRIRSCEIGRPSLFTWFCAIAGLLVNSNAAQIDMAVTNAVMETKLWEIGFLLVVFGQAYKHNQKSSR